MNVSILRMLIRSCVLVLSWLSVGPGPPAADLPFPAPSTERSGALIDLLPASTVMAVEIRDAAERWSEIRDVAAIREIQDRFFAGSGLTPDDLPRLAGERAVLALVTTTDGHSMIPLAILRPSRLDEAEAILRRAGSAEDDGLALTTRRAGDALWVAPAAASERLGELVAQGGGRAGHAALIEEVDRRLPAGGLARGWVDPHALRAVLLDRVEGVDAGPVALLRSLLAAELDAARFIGFRRELTSDGLVTDAVIGLDPASLPAEVVRALATPAVSPPLLPSPLPPELLLVASFPTNVEATWDWLCHVAELDPRGPLRNFEFWTGEFGERYGRDLRRDLADALGERGWLFLVEGETVDAPQALLVVQTRNAGLLESTLVDLESWLVDLARGFSLGLLSPRAHDTDLSGLTAHVLTFRTPFAEVTGPVFLVTDEYLVVGSGTAAVASGLDLLRSRDRWQPVAVDAGSFTAPPDESIRLRGALLSRWFDAVVARDAPQWRGAIAGLRDLSADVWYERDAIRVHGKIDVDHAQD